MEDVDDDVKANHPCRDSNPEVLCAFQQFWRSEVRRWFSVTGFVECQSITWVKDAVPILSGGAHYVAYSAGSSCASGGRCEEATVASAALTSNLTPAESGHFNETSEFKKRVLYYAFRKIVTRVILREY
ncbi:unnamed protein product [Clavelina lepadiformis]|uniref:Uncharacterized protein n=1 Tax=Clavelina lepadiformis TaxID=159417 RepID=A0ABP0F610_CLALP